MDINEFTKSLRMGNLQRIQAEDDARIKLLLKEFLADQALVEPLDFDRLMSTGILLSKARKHYADLVALTWLLEHPSSKRLDFVSAFLNGLWLPPHRDIPVSPDRVRMLIKAHEASDVTADSEYSFIQALSQVMQHDMTSELRSEIKRVFEVVSGRDYGQPLNSLMSSVINRAIQRTT